jgi:MFS family permease
MGKSLFPYIQLPEIYRAGKMAGIIYSTPFVLFLGALFIPFKNNGLDETNHKRYDFKWLVIFFLCIFVAEFIPFVAFFWTATRYIADFMPPLALLSMMGFWNGYKALQNKKIGENLYLVLGIGLFIISIFSGVALGLQDENKYFKEFNPSLWKAIYQNFYPEFWRQLYSILALFFD